MQLWIEIKRAALRHNFQAVQGVVGDKTKVIAVVKANAYGCGAVECARIFAAEGAAMLAVTRVEEGVELREGGITAPILLLAPSSPEERDEVVQHDLTPAVQSFEECIEWQNIAATQGKVMHAHLKVNTGMNRFGSSPKKVAEILGRTNKFQNFELDSVFTHFANATDQSADATNPQFQQFQDAVYGATGRKYHVCNSAALLRFPEMRLDYVRPGTLLFGQYPASWLQKQNDLKLQDPFSPVARVVAIQKLQPGDKVGYGGEWTAKSEATIAVLAVGYADGLTMEPRARVESPLDAIKSGFERAAHLKKNPLLGRTATINGQKVAFVGRFAMQTSFLDVTKLEGVKIGDEARFSMRRLGAGAHVPRVYIN
ncbi:alanine racemase [bacterium]|nr:MAG: alanine racemase [bacterium]